MSVTKFKLRAIGQRAVFIKSVALASSRGTRLEEVGESRQRDVDGGFRRKSVSISGMLTKTGRGYYHNVVINN